MDKFWKIMIICLFIFSMIASDNILELCQFAKKSATNQELFTKLIKNLNLRLSELEGGKKTMTIFVEGYYDPYDGQKKYLVTDVVEVTDVLMKSHE